MRGKAAKILKELEASGITPAYAGKSCGGQVAIDNKTGSPPPMRGKDYTKRT